MNVREVSLFTLGGTIASTPNDSGQGVIPTLTGERLVELLPGLNEIATVRSSVFRTNPSGDLTFSDLWEMAGRAQIEVSQGSQAIIVTQGTDSLEETSFAIDLVWKDPAPFVFTGAMRSANSLSADGPANLYDSFLTAVSTMSRNKGVLVVMNNDVHLARLVRKSHTSSVASFKSDPIGPIGNIYEGTVRMLFEVPPTPRYPVPEGVPAKVRLITTTLDDEDVIYESLLDSNIDGLVVAGFGGGHTRGAVAPLLEKLAAKIPVVVASRVAEGPSLRQTYGFQGGEIDLQQRGLIMSGGLTPLKSRVLLVTLLSLGMSREQVLSEFQRYTNQLLSGISF